MDGQLGCFLYRLPYLLVLSDFAVSNPKPSINWPEETVNGSESRSDATDARENRRTVRDETVRQKRVEATSQELKVPTKPAPVILGTPSIGNESGNQSAATLPLRFRSGRPRQGALEASTESASTDVPQHKTLREQVSRPSVTGPIHGVRSWPSSLSGGAGNTSMNFNGRILTSSVSIWRQPEKPPERKANDGIQSRNEHKPKPQSPRRELCLRVPGDEIAAWSCRTCGNTVRLTNSDLPSQAAWRHTSKI
jgi:hypothetical protein